jgi:hypothetical protein
MCTFLRRGLALAPAGLALAAFSGCGLLASSTGLPSELPAAIKVVFEDPGRFADRSRTDGTAAPTGTVIDVLAPLDGCWGAYTPDVAQGTEPVQITDFTAIEFGSGGEVDWWTLESAAGFSVLLARHGQYEVLGSNRIRIVERELISYNPLSRQFESTPLDPPVTTEYLATRIEKLLKLRMIDPTGEGDNPVPEASAIVLTQFDCP